MVSAWSVRPIRQATSLSTAAAFPESAWFGFVEFRAAKPGWAIPPPATSRTVCLISERPGAADLSEIGSRWVAAEVSSSARPVASRFAPGPMV